MAAPGELYWLGLLVASGGGFLSGVFVTICWRLKVSLKVGRRYVQMPHWAVVCAAFAAAIAVVGSSAYAFLDPTVLSISKSIVMLVLMGAAAYGLVRGDG